MRVRAVAISWVILLGCGGARESGSATATSSSKATTPPTPPSTASSGPASSPSDTPQPAPAGPTDTPPAPPDTTPAPTPPVGSPQRWAGTQVFSTPWTELAGVATLPGGGLVAFGSQFVTKDGIGSRRGTLAWTDATGKVKRVLAVPQADEIFSMVVSSSGAIALGGYTQGTGGYVLVLDADAVQQWVVSMGPSVAVYGVAFAANGDLVACGSNPDSFIGRWAGDGTLLWRKTYPVNADGFSFGIAITPSGELAAAGGRGPVVAVRTAADGTTLWTRTLAVGSPSSGRGAIAVDAAGAVLLAGRDVDDAFVAKIDPAGNTAWLKMLATTGVDTANGIAVNPAGDTLVVGSYGLGSGGDGTGYVARYNPAGEQEWTADLSFPGIEVLGSVALDPAGNAYVVGSLPSDAFGFRTEGFLAKVSRDGVVQ
jgi:hypothetical protein